MKLIHLTDELRFINYNKMIHLQSKYNQDTMWNIDLFTKDDIDLKKISKYGLMWYYIKTIINIDPLYDIERFKTFDLTMLRTLEYNDWKIIFSLGKYVNIVYPMTDLIVNTNEKYKFLENYDNTKIKEYCGKKFGEYICDTFDAVFIFNSIKEQIETTKLYNVKKIINYIYKLFPFIENIGVALETIIIILHNRQKYDFDEKKIYLLEKLCEETQTLFYSIIYFCYSNIELNENHLVNQINVFFSNYSNRLYKIINLMCVKNIDTLLKILTE